MSDRAYVEQKMKLFNVSSTELASWRGISPEQMEDDLSAADSDPYWADLLVDMAWNYSCARTNNFGRWWP